MRLGSSLIAVGSGGTCCVASEVRGAIWVSSDGDAWELAPPQEALAGATLSQAATDGSTILALGAVWPETSSGPHIIGERAVFRSTDGRAWERLPNAPELSRLVDGSGRFVGVENRGDSLVAWVSEDGGDTWQDHPMPGRLEEGDERFAVNAAVGGPDGTVVVVGAVVRMEPASGASWVSADGGATWAWSDAAVPGTELRQVARSGDRFVALGGSSMTTSVFVSDDGLSWAEGEVVRHATWT